MSDFLAADYETQLRIARRRHDIIPITVSDPREREMPPMGIVDWIDNETGERHMADTRSRAFRESFAQRVDARRSSRDTLFRRMKTDGIELTTGESIAEPLTRFFRKREARIRSGR